MDTQTMITQLTQPTTHTEPITQPQQNPDGTITWHTQRHKITWPSLLDQLIEAVTQSTSAEEGPRPGFGSKPPARIDAIDAYARIDKEATTRLTQLGAEQRGLCRDLILRINGLLPAHQPCANQPRKHEDCCTRHAIERDIRNWWTTARVLTGWDKPAWTPRNTCPLCGKRSTLKMRVEQETAVCTNCHETWAPSEFYLLVEHIRDENKETEGESA